MISKKILSEACVPSNTSAKWLSIRAICFDLDNTLWDIWPTLVRAEQVVYAFLAERYPKITQRYSLESLRSERERVIREHSGWSHDVTQIRIHAIQACAESVGYSEPVGQAAFDVFIRERNVVTLYRDALPALDRLKQRYRLFSLTNGNADLQAIGLDSYFEASFAASDIGVLKPASAAFEYVINAARLKPHEIMHVGDDPIADVRGAHAAGLHPVWLNREGSLWALEHGGEPTTIARLDELLAMVDEGI
jgi:FMN hydrolase / 5-amino-6-(5-phospho-D-ribitylamino)uracil phosphatase